VPTQKSSWNLVLRLTLKSLKHIDFCWLRNRWWKLGLWEPKNHARSPFLRLTLTSSSHMDFCWLRNSWRKLSPSCPKNNPSSPVLRLTLKSSRHIDYCRLKNRWWKLGLEDPKIIQEASSTTNTDIFRAQWLLLTEEPLMKTESLCPKNNPRNLILLLTLKSSDYYWGINRWWKMCRCRP